MPELPEVEFGRKLAESVAAGRTIDKVTVHRDPIVFDGITPARITRALTHRHVQRVCRRGKQLWMELDARPWPLFHFGMTGSFRIPESRPLALASSPSSESDTWPPRFAKLHLHFDDGGELVMVNKRRLGRILLRDDPENQPPISRLGFDPLLDMPDYPAFRSRLNGRRGNIKALLLNQRFAAGVGNWIADEILFQAAVDPNRTADSLTDPEIRRIRNKMSAVIRRAVLVDADKTRLPKSWLFHHRWGKDDDATTSTGDRIIFETVGGRTTAWVPTRQS